MLVLGYTRYMKRSVFIIALWALPFLAFAATTAAAQNLVFTGVVAPMQNVYLAGGSVTVASPSPADLLVAGGSVVTSDSVGGDMAVLGGSIAIRGATKGDLRALGGKVSLEAPVAGDLGVIGLSIIDSGAHAKDVLVAGGTVQLKSGSRGSVRAYGNDIYLSGTFDGNVRAIAFNKLVLAPNTVIHGALQYEASEAATIPSSAKVDGGVTYTGASFLPTSREAEAFTLAGIGIFFLVRILGALIVAGLLAGLFPIFSNNAVSQVLQKPTRHVFLLTLLGFGSLVATPVLIALLSITFVGLGIALVLASAYMLLLFVSFAYSGIIVGATFAHVFMKRDIISWRDAIFGMLVLMIIGVVPTFGHFAVALLVCLSSGVIISLFYNFAFHHTLKDIV